MENYIVSFTNLLGISIWNFKEPNISEHICWPCVEIGDIWNVMLSQNGHDSLGELRSFIYLQDDDDDTFRSTDE